MQAIADLYGLCPRLRMVCVNKLGSDLLRMVWSEVEYVLAGNRNTNIAALRILLGPNLIERHGWIFEPIKLHSSQV